MNHCRISKHRKACYSIAWKNDSAQTQCWKVEARHISDVFSLSPGETRYWIVDASARISISVQHGDDWSAEETGVIRYSGLTGSWAFYAGQDNSWDFEQSPGSISLVFHGHVSATAGTKVS